MLEIKNLKKTYKAKGGVVTKALDDVTVTFPEKGMVFLLGKSGSGKSTLLNVCGGLDTPDSGEIIVCGRSSKTFSGSDFDSYRNTFIGFIFQEYNILNEFSVEDNLALALELQGKPKDREKVKHLLEQVDMAGFGKRKPNTLSGGQKQRIAIARALIKEPRIIMADEPTGALDSATGKQVFDTLKKLSADRLVIVVSHDREFAEIYGDRIIELKDGKIISDETKEKVASEMISDNVSVIAADTLSVKSGKSLSDADVKRIAEFIKNSDGELLISGGEKNVAAFKAANRIAEDGSSERFEKTDTDGIKAREYTKEESTFVRSRLPFAKAVKMGASSLRVKPFRLFLTLLLSTVAFVMFGVASTLMAYREGAVLSESFAASDYKEIALNNYYYVHETYYNDGKKTGSYDSENLTYFTDEDYSNFVNKMGTGVIPAFKFGAGKSSNATTVKNAETGSSVPVTMTDFSVTAFAAKGGGNPSVVMLAGNYPEQKDEVAVSSFFAKTIMKNKLHGVKDDGNINYDETISVGSESDLVGKKVICGIAGQQFVFKISGVFSAGEISDKYDGYDDPDKIAKWNFLKVAAFSAYLSETLQKVFFVSDDFYGFVAEKTSYTPSVPTDRNKYFKDGQGVEFETSGDYGVWFYSYREYDKTAADMLPVYFFGEEKTALSRGEIIVELQQLPGYGDISDEDAERWKNSHTEYSAKSAEENALAESYYNTYTASGQEDKEALYEYKKHRRLSDVYNVTADSPYAAVSQIKTIASVYGDESDRITEEEKNIYTPILREIFTDYVSLVGSIRPSDGAAVSGKIAGFYYNPARSGEDLAIGAYISSDDVKIFKYATPNYVERRTAYKLKDSAEYYDLLYIPCNGAHKADFERVLRGMNGAAADDSFYSTENSLYRNIKAISGTVSTMKKVFLYVGIVFAAFAALLLFNFITISINDKMHEIGVLRAVGARGTDVFKIFFSESFIISAICLVVSVVGTIFLLSYLNGEITGALTFSMRLLVFGPVSLGMMIAVALGVAFLGTFLPVLRISRKKPVDSMRAG